MKSKAGYTAMPGSIGPAQQLLESRLYMVYAAAAGLLLGSSNFLIDGSVRALGDSYRVYCLQGFGMLAYCIGYHLWQAGQLYQDKGRFWSREDSYYFRESKAGGQEPDWQVLGLMAARYACSVAGSVLGVLLFRTAILAGVSSALIVSLLSGTSIVTSLLFYLVFGELLHRKHYLGIGLIIASVYLVSQAQPAGEAGGQLSVLWPMLVALALSVIYSLNSLITRFIKHLKIPSLQYSADSSLLTALIIITLFLREHYSKPYSLKEAAPVVTASLFLVSSSLCINLAMAHGKAGPAQALIQVQAPWQLILEAVMYRAVPSVSGVLGIALSISAVLLIIFLK